MKSMSKYLLCVCGGLMLLTSVAEAVCPVCTIAIGAGLEGMRVLGVKDVITGIWAGGLTVSLIGWTANYMRKHNIKNPTQELKKFFGALRRRACPSRLRSRSFTGASLLHASRSARSFTLIFLSFSFPQGTLLVCG